jgi:cytochrome c556
MNTKKKFMIAATAIVLGLAVAVPGAVYANLQEEREQNMKNVVGAVKKLVPVFKGEVAFDGAMVAEQGMIANENFVAASGKFPEGSVEGRALPVIWERHMEFEALFDDAIAASAAIAAAGKANDEEAFKAAFQQMGGACKDCHETYRKPEN